MDELSSRARLIWYFTVALLVIGTLLCFAPLTFHVGNLRLVGALIGAVGLLAIGLLLIITLRKSSWLLHFLLLFFPFFLLELYFQAHVRDMGQWALWMYKINSFPPFLQPVFLRLLVTMASFAWLAGPGCLWLTCLLIRVWHKKGVKPPKPSQPLFIPEWTNEEVKKPARPLDFWILRVIGFFYMAYFFLLLVGSLGTSLWPKPIREFIEMANANPLFSVGTCAKMAMLILLAFQAAYNKQLRWHATLVLCVAHAVALTTSVVFYLLGNDCSSFPVLRFAILFESLLVGLLALVLIRSFKKRYRFEGEENFPDLFSIPATLLRNVFTIFGILTIGWMLLMLGIHFWGDPKVSWGALFSRPDPMLGNALTAYSVMAMLYLMTAHRESLRKYFFSVLLVGYWTFILIGLLWLGVADVCVRPIATKNVCFGVDPTISSCIPVQKCFVLIIVMSAVVLGILIALRRMYYQVDYTITSLSPASAHNIIGIHQSVFGDELDNSSEILQSVDRYIGSIRGRKRGILNFPFWLIENVFSWLLGFYPPFSSMAKDEQRYLFRKRMIRPPQERAKAFSPELAELANQMGVAAHAIVLFATYSNIKKHHQIGYVAPGARDRLQPECITGLPPFDNIAPLPADEKDAVNYQSSVPPAPATYRIPAPRISTPVNEPDIPEEVDYLIIGSGPGGAVMAYRLASEHKTAKILVVERGNRYSPLQDFNDREMEMMAKVYKEGGLQQTKRANMFMLQGECVGGGSVINNAVCYQMPGHVVSQWQTMYGIDLSNIGLEYARIATELGISPLANTGINQQVKKKFDQGLNWFNANRLPHEQILPLGVAEVNGTQEIGDGLWNIGNKYLRKRSVLETYIPWAESRGEIGSATAAASAQVSVVSNTDAVQFLHTNNRAEAVVLRTALGALRSVKVKKAVIVAGGAIASSHFLMRSGVKGAVGKQLSCNFAFPMAFSFGESIKAFDGEQITMGAFDPQKKIIFETYFNPPSAFALSIPFYFDKHYEWMQQYAQLLNFGALVGSEAKGIIEPKADLLNGRAFSWSLGLQDQQNIKYALSTLLELGYGAGAQQAVIPTQPGIMMDLTQGNLDTFNKRLAQYPLSMNDLLMSTAHPQGGNYMAGDTATADIRNQRVVDGDFRVQGLQNVFVADASLFPTSIHVNPQWTIMAMSSLASQKVLAFCP
ncbi:MAG: GMC family oxidoreductase N-terminal domain-containing protein [Bacteroidota bacterium]